MASKSKYHPELIKKAKKMWDKGFSIRVIVAEFGFENEWACRYHVDPTYKARVRKATAAWTKKNLKKHQIASNKYQRWYYANVRAKGLTSVNQIKK